MDNYGWPMTQNRCMPYYCCCPIKYNAYLMTPISSYQNQRKSFSLEEAIQIGNILGIDWKNVKFKPQDFMMGLNVELEHGRRDPYTNVTGDDPILTGKIALAHLNEFPDYYIRLAKLEKEAKTYYKIRD